MKLATAKHRDFLSQLGWFVIVGGLTYLVYCLILYVAETILRFSAHWSVATGYLAAFLFHFVGNRYVTFAHRRTEVAAELRRYAVAYVLPAILSYLIGASFMSQRTGAWAYLLPIISAAIGYVLSSAYVWRNEHRLLSGRRQ